MKTKKEIVLEVATQLFAEQGFENTSMANICELAKVSKGLVYHHFKSKDEILKEIFSLTTEKMMEMNEPELDNTPQEKLVNLIQEIFTQLAHKKTFFQLNLNITFQPSTRALLNDQIKQRSANLLSAVKAIFDELQPQDSTTYSFMFIAEIDGIALDYLSVYENYPLDEVIAHLIAKYQSM